MSAMINPEITEIRQRQDAQGKEIAELRDAMLQISKYLSDISRQSTLQIAAIVITLCLTIAGGLYFQTNAINRQIEQIDKRFEQIGERINGIEKRMDRLESRMDRIDQNLLELTKELRASRQSK